MKVIDIEPVEENLFRGSCEDSAHVFGGQVLAQAISAAFQTVDPSRRLHAVHAYFLTAGDWQAPILYEVQRIRDGRSFNTRLVVAFQHGRAIFNLSSSWHKKESGFEHTMPMPHVPPPDALRDDRDAYLDIARQQGVKKHGIFRYDAIDSRQVEGIPSNDNEVLPAAKHTWMRTRDKLDDNPRIHLCLMAYMSDMDFMNTSKRPHNIGAHAKMIQGASLDHALWIHRPFRVDEWLLFAKESPNAHGARGFVRGHFFREDGTLVATAAQECLIRLRR